MKSGMLNFYKRIGLQLLPECDGTKPQNNNNFILD